MKEKDNASIGFRVRNLAECVLLGFLFGGASFAQSLAHPLEGHWQGSGPGGSEVSITIEDDSLYFFGREDFWYKTSFVLPAEEALLKELHATIRDSSPPKKDIGYVVYAIYKIEGDALTLAPDDGRGEAYESFDDAMTVYELKKVPPKKEMNK